MAVQPDGKTGPHHHGELETVLYVVRGRIRMRWAISWNSARKPGLATLFTFRFRTALGDQRQPGRDLRSCSCKKRTGSDCCQLKICRLQNPQGRAIPACRFILIAEYYQ
jgi:hypothetical protein